MANLTLEEMIEIQRRMMRIRMFDERASKMVKRGHIPGTVHTSIGQEAQVVGDRSTLQVLGNPQLNGTWTNTSGSPHRKATTTVTGVNPTAATSNTTVAWSSE